MDESIAALPLVGGGRISLDFTNTADMLEPEVTGDYLEDYGDLLDWGLHVDLLDPDEAEALRKRAAEEPEDAARVFARAIALRGAAYRVFAAAAAGEVPPPADLEAINREWALTAPHLRLSPGNACCAWGWDDYSSLERPLWPLVRDTVQLLTSDELARVRECGGERCTWLFLDTSRNRSRRWCDMATCGNRAKARRHYHRAKGADAAD